MSDENKTADCSQSGTTHGYRVEAMYDYPEPLTVGEQIFTRDWKIVSFNRGACGVPIGPRFELPWLESAHCVSYQAAQALRWWLHATVGAEGLRGLCLRSRIVKYAIKYSMEATRVSEHQEIGGDDRGNLLPDWGSSK